jgi:uncharacterized membrane protein YgdD (TMEM256/DUF423 family)
MQNRAMVFAGVSGCLAVILGAFGAHYLKDKVENNLLSPKDLDAYKTAVNYQLFHTLAIMGVFMVKDKLPLCNRTIVTFFMVGIVLFSGSIYLLSTASLTGLNLRWLGPVTPLGGLAFIGGWICLTIAAIKQKEVSKQ